MRTRGEEGLMLLQAVVLVLILALIASATFLLLMGRAMVVEKVTSTEQGKSLGQSAISRANDCMQNVTAAACNNAALTSPSCGFPMDLGKKDQKGNEEYITASAVWDNASGACQVSVTVPDQSTAP